MGNGQSQQRPAKYRGYEQSPAPNPASQKIPCGIASRPADRLLRPAGRLTPAKLTHQAFWYQVCLIVFLYAIFAMDVAKVPQTPDGYNHYIGLGKELNERPVWTRESGWRREKAHKDDRNQYGFIIRSNKDLMPLSTAMDPSGMDELGEYTAHAPDTSMTIADSSCNSHS
jgi:hypothetical protein